MFARGAEEKLGLQVLERRRPTEAAPAGAHDVRIEVIAARPGSRNGAVRILKGEEQAEWRAPRACGDWGYYRFESWGPGEKCWYLYWLGARERGGAVCVDVVVLSTDGPFYDDLYYFCALFGPRGPALSETLDLGNMKALRLACRYTDDQRLELVTYQTAYWGIPLILPPLMPVSWVMEKTSLLVERESIFDVNTADSQLPKSTESDPGRPP